MEASLLQCWEEKELQVTGARQKVRTQVPSPSLPCCSSGPSLFVIQRAHGRQKEILVSFIIHTERSLPQIKRRQHISLELTYINVTVLKVHFLQELLL